MNHSRIPVSAQHIFFDLDDTLYAPERGVWREIGRRINRYMVDRIGIPEIEVDDVRKKYFCAYGTTLNGLRKEYGVDPWEYLQYVHDIPLDQYLQSDELLRTMLLTLPQKKYIFSNADRPYIQRVIDALGIEDQFEAIIDIFTTDFACKPMEAAYRIALQTAGSPSAATCLLIDDLPRNLVAASALGMTSVLVHHTHPIRAAFHQIDTIYQLADLLA